MEKSPEAQLDEFIDKYRPEIAAEARKVLAKMRQIVPACREYVFDNYNALVVGFAAGDTTGSAPFSIALYPRWITLFFLQGASIDDPYDLLKGDGNVVRQIRLGSADDLDKPQIRDLMEIAMARVRFPATEQRQVIIKSISAKQRPRRPG